MTAARRGVLEFVESCGKNVAPGSLGVTATLTDLGTSEFYYYKVSIKEFNQYCKKLGGKGTYIKNGLLAKMLSYCTDYMQSQKEVYDKAYRYSFKETPKSPNAIQTAVGGFISVVRGNGSDEIEVRKDQLSPKDPERI